MSNTTFSFEELLSSDNPVVRNYAIIALCKFRKAFREHPEHLNEEGQLKSYMNHLYYGLPFGETKHAHDFDLVTTAFEPVAVETVENTPSKKMSSDEARVLVEAFINTSIQANNLQFTHEDVLEYAESDVPHMVEGYDRADVSSKTSAMLQNFKLQGDLVKHATRRVWFIAR